MSVATLTTEVKSTRGSLWSVAAKASVAAAAVAEVATLAARAVDVPMRAADPGAAAAKAIPVGGIFMAVLMNAVVGLVVAAALARWTRSSARYFTWLATTYAVLSLLGPVLAAHTHVATKLVLAAAHVIAAVMIIPPVSAALRADDSGQAA